MTVLHVFDYVAHNGVQWRSYYMLIFNSNNPKAGPEVATLLYRHPGGNATLIARNSFSHPNAIITPLSQKVNVQDSHTELT